MNFLQKYKQKKGQTIGAGIFYVITVILFCIYKNPVVMELKYKHF